MFDSYVEKVTSLYPGFVTRLFEKFTGPVDNPINYIGRQERLTEHLVEVLALWGEKCSEVLIREVAPLNATERMVLVGDEVRRKLYVSEKVAFDRYGYRGPAAGAT